MHLTLASARLSARQGDTTEAAGEEALLCEGPSIGSSAHRAGTYDHTSLALKGFPDSSLAAGSDAAVLTASEAWALASWSVQRHTAQQE